MKSGVYAIVNKVTGKKYIGSSKNLEKRKRSHFSNLRRKCHHNVWLQRSYDKHGPKSFVFVVIEECDPEQLFEREKFHIESEQSCKDGLYNVGSVGGGDNTSKHPLNHEIRKRIAASQMGKKMKPRYGEENPNWRGGASNKKCAKCGKRITSYGVTGYCINCLDRAGKANSFYGRSHSERTIEIIRQRNKGKIPTNARPVIVDGQEYASVTEASRHTNITPYAVIFRIRSRHFPGYRYKDDETTFVQGMLF